MAVSGNGEMKKVADPGIQFRDSALVKRYQPCFPTSCVVPFLLVIPILVFFAVPSRFVRAEDGSIQPHLSANQLAAEVVRNELKAQDEDTSLWKYREFHQEDGKAQLFEVVQTKDGEIHRLISVDGKALDAEGAARKTSASGRFCPTPMTSARSKKAGRTTRSRNESLWNDAAARFPLRVQRYPGRPHQVAIQAESQLPPGGNESVVFHHMRGMMLVDRRQHRLAELDGALLAR